MTVLNGKASDSSMVYCINSGRLHLGDAITKQLILPESLRKEVLQQLHNSQTAGHLGVAKTLSRVREERFYRCTGPLPVTEAGNKYILIVADYRYFTKWIEALTRKPALWLKSWSEKLSVVLGYPY